jgi:uncharacterized membrane protein
MSRHADRKPCVADLGRLERTIAALLRVGVACSLVLLAGGITISFIHHPGYLVDPATLDRLTHAGAAFPHRWSDVVSELWRGRGRAVMTLGLAVLIATPVVRVGVSFAAYVGRGDWRFAAITLMVLIVLLISFVLGKVG